jgi:hypothetical protein
MTAPGTARVALPAALAALLLLAGCSSGEDPAGPRSAPRLSFAPAIDHPHGLHVDAEGTVLVGTHAGLLAVDASGGTSPVGPSDDDFMGLTGNPRSDTLFSSGHPGASSSAPNPLGLRSSSDGGRTWRSESLEGAVDFHALAANGNLVVGYDGAGGLLVSGDGGAAWDRRATGPVGALALTDGALWAVTVDGLERSTDEGRTFSAVPGTPALVLLAGAGEALWGLDEDGYAWRSREGLAWEKRSYVGPAAALAAADFDTAYAATAESLYTLD